jgi:hypothetical protein
MTTLYLDCETLPLGTLAHIAAGLTLADPPAGWTCPPYPDFVFRRVGNASKPETLAAQEAEQRAAWEAARDAWPATAIAAEWDRRAGAPRTDGRGREKGASLSPFGAEIACLGHAVDDGPVVVVDGPDALDVLAAVFAAHDPTDIVAHNAAFDAAMIRAAAIRAGRDYLAGWIACWDYGPGREFGITKGPRWRDTQALACLGRHFVKQEELAALMGLAQPHTLRGAEVFDAVMGGRMSDVMTHCAADVGELRGIYRRLWAIAEVRRG